MAWVDRNIKDKTKIYEHIFIIIHTCTAAQQNRGWQTEEKNSELERERERERPRKLDMWIEMLPALIKKK